MNKKSILLILGILLFSLVLIGSTSWWNNDWDYSKEYTNLTGNITYMEINKTVNDNPGFTDTRFISCYNDSLIFNHTLESTFDGQGLSYSSISPYDSGSLVSYYKLDESSGTVLDAHGSNDGTNNGATPNVAGKINTAYDFDGSNDYISISDSTNALKTATDGSVSLWFKTDTVSAQKVLIASSDSSSTGTPYFFVGINNQQLYLSGNDGTNNVEYTGNVLSTGTWYHAVWTNDGTNNNFYLNGVLQSKTLVTGVAGKWFGDITGTDTFTIGTIDRQTDYAPWDGLIDEVSIFNKSLSQAEVFELYNGTKGQFRVNNLGENCTKRYYGNSEATSTSSASDVYFNPISAYYLDANANDFVGSNDGTVNGATLSSGYINGSYDFDGTDDYIVSDSNIEITGNHARTISFWATATLDSTVRYMISMGGLSAGTAFGLIKLTDNKLYFMAWGGEYDFTTSYTIPNTNFHFYTITYDGTTVSVYVDGSLVPDGTATRTLDTTDSSVYIGERYADGGTNHWDGKIDEVYIYDKALTQNQINQLYTQTAPNIIEGEEQSQVTDNPPQVILNLPIEYYNSTSSTINFNVTVTDDIEVENVSLYIDGVLNETNSSSFNGTYIFTKTLSEGKHNWSILAFNNNSLSNQSETRNIVIDLTNPTANFGSSATEAGSYDQDWIYNQISSIDTGTGLRNLTLYIYNETELITYSNLNLAAPKGNTGYGANFTSLDYGTYYMNASACDYSNRCSSTGTRTIILDSPPVVNLISPENNSNFTVSLITFNGTAYDDINLVNVSLILDGVINETNSSGINNSNYIFTKTLNLGTHNWTYKVCDSIGSCTTAENRYFIIKESNVPNVTINSPLNQTYGTNSITFNITAIDDTEIDSCVYSLNDGNNITMERATFAEGTYTEEYFSTSGRTGITNNGTYFWTTDTVSDEVYKYWMNGTYTGDHFDVAATGLNYPRGITYYNDFLWITDSEDAEVYKFDLDGTYASFSFDTAASGNTGPYGITNNGTYFWIVNVVNDAVYKYWVNGTYAESSFSVSANGNNYPHGITTDGIYLWIIDSSLPHKLFKYYLNETYINNFEIKGTNGVTNNGTYFWSIQYTEAEVYKSYMAGYYVGDYYTATNSSMIDGLHNVNYYCNDTFGNINGSESVFFSVDTTRPNIQIVYPENTTYAIGPTTLDYTVNDTHLDTCWYSLDKGITNNSIIDCANLTGLISIERLNNWTVYANDTLGNENSSIIHFTVDTITPLIEYSNGTEENNTYFNRNWIYINVSVEEMNEKNITFYLYNTTELIDSITYTNETYEVNFTGLTDNSYFYNVTIFDIVNHSNSTETRKITLDTVFPLINLTYPISTNYSGPVTQLNYTFNETNPDNCWYSLDLGITNVSITCGNNVSGLSSEVGVYSTWIIWINDSVGQTNSSNVTFYTESPYKDFNITITPNTLFWFYPDNGTHQGVPAYNQTDLIGVFTANNNLTNDISIWAKLNTTNTNITLKIGDNSTYVNSVSITDSYVQIYENLSIDSTIYLWAWADYNNPLQPWYPELEISGVYL